MRSVIPYKTRVREATVFTKEDDRNLISIDLIKNLIISNIFYFWMKGHNKEWIL